MNVTQQSVSPIIEVLGLKNYLGDRWIHSDVNFSVYPGEIVAIIGGSGCGKTTLLRTLLMLQPPTAGTIKLFNKEIQQCNFSDILAIKRRWGVLFQMNALFSSLTVLENIMFPMEQQYALTAKQRAQIALLKIKLVGLAPSAAHQYPAELSGGMQKRAALARAIALDPELLFLDEPTAGLDPNSAAALDQLLLKLRANLGITLVMVTHDLDTLRAVADRIFFLGEGKVLAVGPIHELMVHSHPLIQEYFSGYRGQARQ